MSTSEAPAAVPALYAGADAGPRPETRAHVCAALKRGVDPVAVVERVASGIDAIHAELQALGWGGEPRPACARGCSHCCHQRVELTTPEVFRLARVLRARDDRALLDRVTTTAKTLSGLDARVHHEEQVPCALLDADGGCSVYAERPLACRRAHSTDATVCAAVRRDPKLRVLIPSNAALEWNASALVVGYYEGSAAADRPPHQHELHAALDVALRTSDAEARFIAGDDLLAAARTRDANELAAVLGKAQPPGD